MLALSYYHSDMSKDLPPSRTAEQFVVRFPDGMRDLIAEAAKANNRSMNAEIVSRLQSSFGPAMPDPTGDATLDAYLAKMRAQWLQNHERQFAEFVEMIRGGTVEFAPDGSVQRISTKPNDYRVSEPRTSAPIKQQPNDNQLGPAELDALAERSELIEDHLVKRPIVDKASRFAAGLKNARKRTPK